MRAVWMTDYDYSEDKNYKRPGHYKCYEGYESVPIVKQEGKYICINCREEMKLDPEMQYWIDRRSETKTKVGKCIRKECNGVMKFTYGVNKATLQWELRFGKCEKCGCKIRV